MTELDQERTGERTLFPSPGDGAELGINPDSFVWLPVDGAERYELEVRTAADGDLVLRERVTDHYYVPGQPFPTGEYTWEFRALDGDGDSLGERAPWRFDVPGDVPTAVPPDAEAVLAAVDDAHPRLVFPAGDLDAVRERVRTEQASTLEALEELVEEAYGMGMPPKPEFHLEETQDERMQHYQDYFGELRGYIDRNLRACALYYLLAEDEEAGAFAREMLLHVCGWNPEGPNSVEWLWGDEPGLSYARVLPEVYDWTYDRFDDSEREYVERTLAQYTRQTYDRMRGDGFFENPSRSHLGRLPGYLGEQVLVLADRLPDAEAREMLQYALDVFTTFYPYWGGEDGGWAQGVPYGQWYNRWYVPFFATLERQTGFSLWDRPFYRSVRDFFVYCAPPNADAMPFGDGQAENRPGRTLKRLLELWASVYDSPVAAWRADQIEASGVSLAELAGTVYPPPDDVPDAADLDLPDSTVFRDVGWAALHSDLTDPERDNYLVFRSSPYGNVSHSHNNQNAFCVASGGRMLAISSGYYPRYGSPHHAEWTRETRAHNSVLVDGEGQERGVHATGEITAFDDGAGYTYLRGEAADAYAALERFHRHVLFVEPGTYLVYDDLAAPTPSTFGWLLHTQEEPGLRETDGGAEITASRGDARLRARLFVDGTLDLRHTDAFDPPVNEGLIEELRQDRPDQHHVTAETEERAATKVLAVVDVWQGEDEPETACERVGDEVRVTAPAFSGAATVGEGPASLTGELRGADGTTRIDRP